MSKPHRCPGKFVWFELASADPKKAQAFYGEVLGWTVRGFPMDAGTYEMIYAGETMIGGYASTRSLQEPARWTSFVSVEDVDAAAKIVVAKGGRLLEAPHDVPSAGRMLRIADPQGAEVCLFTKLDGDPPDTPASQGQWVWNELHTREVPKAVAFYESVLGFSHTSMDMGPAGTYHVLERGGVGRGGVTGHLPGGATPHWLPYAYVNDVDAAVARARNVGGSCPFGPEDIPGAGRIGAVSYPGGATLAVMKPLPRG